MVPPGLVIFMANNRVKEIGQRKVTIALIILCAHAGKAAMKIN
jgi:hypothetical protein